MGMLQCNMSFMQQTNHFEIKFINAKFAIKIIIGRVREI